MPGRLSSRRWCSFDVDLNFRFAMPRDVEEVDPQQEARYEQCMDEQDRIVHGETFAAIDNPDVQREVLARRMREAEALCRSEFPRRTTTVRRPFEFNIVDLERTVLGAATASKGRTCDSCANYRWFSAHCRLCGFGLPYRFLRCRRRRRSPSVRKGWCRPRIRSRPKQASRCCAPAATPTMPRSRPPRR